MPTPGARSRGRAGARTDAAEAERAEVVALHIAINFLAFVAGLAGLALALIFWGG